MNLLELSIGHANLKFLYNFWWLYSSLRWSPRDWLNISLNIKWINEGGYRGVSRRAKKLQNTVAQSNFLFWHTEILVKSPDHLCSIARFWAYFQVFLGKHQNCLECTHLLFFLATLLGNRFFHFFFEGQGRCRHLCSLCDLTSHSYIHTGINEANSYGCFLMSVLSDISVALILHVRCSLPHICWRCKASCNNLSLRLFVPPAVCLCPSA